MKHKQLNNLRSVSDNIGATSTIRARNLSKKENKSRYLKPKIWSSAFVCICLKWRKHEAKQRESKNSMSMRLSRRVTTTTTQSFHIQRACIETTVTPLVALKKYFKKVW